MKTLFITIFKFFKSPIFLTTVGLLLLYAFILALYNENTINKEKIHEAEVLYRKGESAENVSVRNKAFNESLKIYSQLENDFDPEYGTGRLYYDIGNTYYQLGQYPFAILYYSKALNLMPRQTVVQRNLEITRKKIGVVSPPHKNIFLRPPLYLSLPEYLQIFAFSALLSIFIYSFWIWTKRRTFKNIAFFCMTICSIVFIHLILIRYLSPVDAVMVHAADLRRDAGIEFAKVGDRPVPSGTLVNIIGVSENQNEPWVKITLPTGEFGFVPQDALRKI